MSEQFKRRKRKNTVNRALLAVLSFVIVLVVAAGSIFVIENFVYDDKNYSSSGSDTQSGIVSVPSEPDKPEPITKVSTATIAATGDLLMHEPIITHSKFDEGYNFDLIYTYLKDYASKVDYSVANLETTLRGIEDGYEYSGYPQFNCPDEIVDATKNAGFDMLLTANNHSYDTRYKGMIRTLEVIDEKGLDRLGIIKEETEKKYTVKDINGIKIGMICYTYETDTDPDEIALNGIALNEDAEKRVNAFSYGELDTFYETIEGQFKAMKEDGAEALVLFIHWGDEYQTKQNKKQSAIAQKLCDLGVDVIVGGHPHVVQPIDLLTSESDPNHKTVCLYSMGNAVSNQRRERMNLKTGHTEDGVLFQFTFAKYSDGTVVLENADILPTWVNMFTSKATGKKVYQIIPLDTEKTDWKEAFDLTDNSEAKAKESLERTQKIVGDGLKKVQDYLRSDENAYPKPETLEPTDSSDVSSETVSE
ncbi:MAG: CapA family protein [Clostridia bacterium]|nr:CapA family protein [Clostridia bacterium]